MCSSMYVYIAYVSLYMYGVEGNTLLLSTIDGKCIGETIISKSFLAGAYVLHYTVTLTVTGKYICTLSFYSIQYI